MTTLALGRAIIKPGCGYWDCTRFPIGGDFRRATAPVEITVIEELEKLCYGCRYVAITDSGSRVALNASCIEWVQEGGAA